MDILALNAENLQIKTENKFIYDMLSFSVEKNTIYGIIAPTGSGKTQIIQTILGIKKPLKGKIELLGEKIPDRKILRFIGYLPKQKVISSLLTVEENLYYFARMYGLTYGQIKWKATELLMIFGLKDKANIRVSSISFDDKVKVAFATCLIHCPMLLILDDPFGGMSVQLTQFLYEHIKYQKEQGNTVIFTSQNVQDAMICDKVLILHSGRLLIEAKPQDIIAMTKAKSIEEAVIRLF